MTDDLTPEAPDLDALLTHVADARRMLNADGRVAPSTVRGLVTVIERLSSQLAATKTAYAASNRIHIKLIEQINDALGLDPDDDQTCVPGCVDGPAGSAHSLWHLVQQRDQATAEVRAKELEDAADAEPGWPVKPWLRARAACIREEQP